MASSVTISHRSPSSFVQPLFQSPNPHCNFINPRLQFIRTPLHLLQASRRISNFYQEGNNLADDYRNWSRNRGVVIDDYDYDDEDDEDDEEDDRSLDLLVRFIQNVFKKVSRKARKAVRSILPLSISTKLVGFSVNGVIMLAFLWVLKAFIQVVCTLGTIVFVSILVIRGIWAGVSYIQEGRSHKMNEFYYQQQTWSGTRPAT